MRHRAPRPLIDLLARVRRAAATALGAAARRGPLRALVAVLMVIGLGTVALAVVPSLVDGGSEDTTTDTAAVDQRSGPPVSRDGDRTSPEPDESRSPKARVPAATPSESPSTEPPEARPDRATPTRARTSPSAVPSLPSPSAPQPTSATASPEPEDVTPPETSLSAEHPSGDTARFSFSADEPASFTCSLDEAAYTPCDSPMLYSGLEPGWHTFAVRATDTAGNVDPSPAQERWLATKAPSGQDQG
jgi:hypothetical protein